MIQHSQHDDANGDSDMVGVSTSPSPDAELSAVPQKGSVARSFVFWLAIAAMIALFAVALWRLQSHTKLAEQRLVALEQQNRALVEQLDQQQQQHQALQAAQAMAHQEYEHMLDDLRAELSGGAPAFAETQRLHAAKYLIHQAVLHVQMGRDVNGAVVALSSALTELQTAVSEPSNRLRAAIQADIQTLKKMEVSSPLDIARALNQIQVKVAQLQPLRTTLGNGDKGLNLIQSTDGWWGTLKQSWDQYAGEWFVVRHHEDIVHAPPDELENRKIKLALSLALSEAQLASVHSDTMLYAESIKRARSLAIAFYNQTDLGEDIANDLDIMLSKTIALDSFMLSAEQEATK